jgi:cytochrome P450
MGAPFVGEALKFLKDPFKFTLDRTKQHGNVWKTKILSDTVVFFAGPKAFSFFMDADNFTRQNGSPKFLQELLDPDAVPFLDGDRHKTRKRLLLSAFTKDALDSYLPAVFTIIERFVPTWTSERQVAPDLAQLGFDIADYLFGASDPKTSNTDGAANFERMNKGAFAPPIKLPFTAYGKALKARDRFRSYIRNQISSADGKGTALGILKGARGPNGEQLSPIELEIEMLHFYFAAHGGLTAAFAWALVVLGEHPDLAKKLRAEADAVLGAWHPGNAGDAPPTHAQVHQLPIARAVWREILRSYPIAPVTFIGVAKKDLELDGFHIRAGWKGAGAIWATLQDGSTFRDPTQFRDDRLGDDAIASLPHNAFVPQGGGPPDGHRCAGEALTSLVVPAFLAWFTRRYDLVFPQQEVSPGGGGLGPLPKSGVRIAIKRRG